MGTLYVFVNIGDRKYLDLPAGKLAEIKGCQMCKDMIAQYLTGFYSGGSSADICFIENVRFYDKLNKEHEFEDITADVLFDMFEDGYQPKFHQFNWIYKKFEEKGRLKDLTRWFEEWDKKKK